MLKYRQTTQFSKITIAVLANTSNIYLILSEVQSQKLLIITVKTAEVVSKFMDGVQMLFRVIAKVRTFIVSARTE